MEQTLPLADIHLPDTISAWPPAIGWWLLVLLGIAIIVGIFYGLKRHQQKWRYRRAALALLHQHYQTWQAQQSREQLDKRTKTVGSSQESTTQCANEMMAILKRTVLTAYGDDKATLFGKAWVNFINQRINHKTQKDLFSDKLAEWMINQQYQKVSKGQQDTVHIPTLYRACEKWIKQHKSISPQDSAHISTEKSTEKSTTQGTTQRGPH